MKKGLVHATLVVGPLKDSRTCTCACIRHGGITYLVKLFHDRLASDLDVMQHVYTDDGCTPEGWSGVIWYTRCRMQHRKEDSRGADLQRICADALKC